MTGTEMGKLKKILVTELESDNIHLSLKLL